MKYYVVDKSDREDLPFMSNSFEMCTDGKDQFDWFGNDNIELVVPFNSHEDALRNVVKEKIRLAKYYEITPYELDIEILTENEFVAYLI
jgi:hypothetical protein